MTDLFEFDLISARSSTNTRRTYSQRNLSALQLQLTKNRKLINVNTSKTTILNRTMSFRPLSETSSSLANVENTPMKKASKELNTSIITSSAQEIIEDTPVKEEDGENDAISSERMTRDVQRLALRLRSSIPLYHMPIHGNQATKPATLHLSQVVNRVSRCNYVLRRYVREAQKYSPKLVLSLPSHEKGRRRLFVDSPKQEANNSNSENQPPTTPRKASGVIKQLFASPSSSFKRASSSSSNTSTIINDKRQKLF